MKRQKIKYWLDTEFIELPERTVTRPKVQYMLGGEKETVTLPATIILISIGIVCEDGREYYAVNTEAECSEASDWVKENVLKKIPQYNKSYKDLRSHGGSDYPKKTIQDIRKELLQFCGQHNNVPEECEFWGYYADYDWVLFCWIFGTMMQLPKGFPKYCRDIKQLMDSYEWRENWKQDNCPDPKDAHNALVDAKWNKLLYEKIVAEINK